ncbi:MAG: cupredoxin domain-containing protein [Gammaproteobacteria bacterium]|nr:cupredoxin domain-containing protein [Gammaproteobacteria bacterium]
MTSLLVNGGALLFLAFIVWWFWLTKPKAKQVAAGEPIEIIVDDGVYIPPRIEVPVGKPVTLRFIRRDASPCAEKVLFDDFGLSAELPIGKPYDLTFTPEQSGEFEFTCQMRMYRGKLVVG